MIKILIITISLIFITSCSTNEITFRDIASLNDARNCNDSMNGFMQTNPTKSGPILTGQNSLASKIPGFENFRNEMLSKRPSIDNFLKKFEEEHPGRRPTNLEVLDFFSNATEDLALHIRSAKGVDERLDLYLELSAAEIELAPNKIEKIIEYKFDSSRYKTKTSRPTTMTSTSTTTTITTTTTTTSPTSIGSSVPS